MPTQSPARLTLPATAGQVVVTARADDPITLARRGTSLSRAERAAIDGLDVRVDLTYADPAGATWTVLAPRARRRLVEDAVCARIHAALGTKAGAGPNLAFHPTGPTAGYLHVNGREVARYEVADVDVLAELRSEVAA